MSADIKKQNKRVKNTSNRGMINDRNVSVALFDDVDKHKEKMFRIKK